MAELLVDGWAHPQATRAASVRDRAMQRVFRVDVGVVGGVMTTKLGAAMFAHQ
jgi:hypothetical protein